MIITHRKISAIPVRPSQATKFTVCMPLGRFICPISPARKEEWKEKENEKVRNEEASAAGRLKPIFKNMVNDLHSTLPYPSPS
jgi:hypothetical protein